MEGDWATSSAKFEGALESERAVAIILGVNISERLVLIPTEYSSRQIVFIIIILKKAAPRPEGRSKRNLPDNVRPKRQSNGP